jgi:DNA-directed RNA polymerase subunit beta
MIMDFWKHHTVFVENGRVTDRIEYLTADEEDKYFIAQANAVIVKMGNL